MGCQAKFAAETYVGKNKFSPFTVLEGFKDITARAIAIQLPIALASFLETIENVEAAELGGDSYNVHEAIQQVPSDEYDADIVCQEFQSMCVRGFAGGRYWLHARAAPFVPCCACLPVCLFV